MQGGFHVPGQIGRRKGKTGITGCFSLSENDTKTVQIISRDITRYCGKAPPNDDFILAFEGVLRRNQHGKKPKTGKNIQNHKKNKQLTNVGLQGMITIPKLWIHVQKGEECMQIPHFVLAKTICGGYTVSCVEMPNRNDILPFCAD